MAATKKKFTAESAETAEKTMVKYSFTEKKCPLSPDVIPACF
jgi:hypothetical protein